MIGYWQEWLELVEPDEGRPERGGVACVAPLAEALLEQEREEAEEGALDRRQGACAELVQQRQRTVTVER